MALQKGELACLNGLSIPNGAENIGQIYAFLDYIYRPNVVGLLVFVTGYNSVAFEAVEYLTSVNYKKTSLCLSQRHF
jgi:spermidine/putrescine transport system substrate-binding protein